MKRIIKDYLLLNDLNVQYSEFLILCIEEMNKNSEYVLNAAIKRRMAENLCLKLGTLNNMITRLVNLGIFIRLDRSIYSLSEDLETIIKSKNQITKIELCYKKEDRTIKVKAGGNEE